MTGHVVALPSTSRGGAGGEGPKKRRREKQAPHDQSDAIFKDDDEERVSRKRDIMGEVLELLKKNEEGGGRTREMGLQALVSQQSTMTNTITSLLQQARLLKEELRQAEDSDEVQDLEDEITGVIQSRREMRQQLLDLDMEIRKETNVVARERMVVVEREHQEQMSRRARDANAARVLQLNSPSPSCSGVGEGQGSREGDGMVEEGGDEEGGD
jgi:hypothetical protein